MSLAANRARLGGVTRELSHQWEQTKVYWRDAKSAEFEKKFLDDLFNSVSTALTVIDDLDKLIAKVRNDCE